MSAVQRALRAVAAEIRANALGMEAEVRATKDGIGKLVLAAEMGAIIRVMRCVERAASAIEAQRAETAQTGSVHESAAPQEDAQ